jgi:hypothetical protein
MGGCAICGRFCEWETEEKRWITIVSEAGELTEAGKLVASAKDRTAVQAAFDFRRQYRRLRRRGSSTGDAMQRAGEEVSRVQATLQAMLQEAAALHEGGLEEAEDMELEENTGIPITHMAAGVACMANAPTHEQPGSASVAGASGPHTGNEAEGGAQPMDIGAASVAGDPPTTPTMPATATLLGVMSIFIGHWRCPVDTITMPAANQPGVGRSNETARKAARERRGRARLVMLQRLAWPLRGVSREFKRDVLVLCRRWARREAQHVVTLRGRRANPTTRTWVMALRRWLRPMQREGVLEVGELATCSVRCDEAGNREEEVTILRVITATDESKVGPTDDARAVGYTVRAASGREFRTTPAHVRPQKPAMGAVWKRVDSYLRRDRGAWRHELHLYADEPRLFVRDADTLAWSVSACGACENVIRKKRVPKLSLLGADLGRNLCEIYGLAQPSRLMKMAFSKRLCYAEVLKLSPHRDTKVKGHAILLPVSSEVAFEATATDTVPRNDLRCHFAVMWIGDKGGFRAAQLAASCGRRIKIEDERVLRQQIAVYTLTVEAAHDLPVDYGAVSALQETCSRLVRDDAIIANGELIARIELYNANASDTAGAVPTGSVRGDDAVRRGAGPMSWRVERGEYTLSKWGLHSR